MGYPGKNHKQYDTPKRRFEKSRIEDEAKLVIEYGLRNKRELWKAQSTLRRYRGAARELLSLVAAATDEVLVERKRGELLHHLQRFGLLGDNPTIDGVLSLKTENELERRLQTLVYRRGLARSPKQARQFITHGHIAISGRKVTIPGYRVNKEEEGALSYYGLSPLTNDVHPERTRITKAGGR
jgi:small subunit ribosomal protein S4